MVDSTRTAKRRGRPRRVKKSDDPLPPREVESPELAGGFIHEIKNHLSTLGLNLQMLAEDFQEPETPRERRAAARIRLLDAKFRELVELSNDYLRFARMRDLRREPCRLDEVIGEMVDFFSPTAREAKVEIRCYWSADLPAVALDRELFKQALLNLMLNAEQAMPGGGELTIQAHSAAGGWVCVSLIDTGAGMTAEVLERVFEPFYSTKAGGSGLGLATVRRIVEAHGGRVEAHSAVGTGTKFELWLPAGGS